MDALGSASASTRAAATVLRILPRAERGRQRGMDFGQDAPCVDGLRRQRLDKPLRARRTAR
jgi:hypothetical protein